MRGARRRNHTVSELVPIDSSTSLVFMADSWGGHPSSAQYIARELLPTTPIYWIETVGVVPPSLSGADLQRGIAQVRRWLQRRAHASGAGRGPTIVAPWLWPDWRTGWQRRWNGRVLASRLASALPSGGGERILVTTLPIAAPLLARTDFDRVVYYCVDDFTVWPGADTKSLRAMEDEVIERSDVVLATSNVLQRRFAEMGVEAQLLEHAVDGHLWRQQRSRAVLDSSAARILQASVRPRLLFWGLIDRRIDTRWLAAAQKASGGTTFLIGPRRVCDPELFRIPGVRWLDAVPCEELPELARLADALLLPYADLPVTRAMQPLKLLEYLSTDLPVIVRDLPACREWADALDAVAGPGDLEDALARRLRDGVPQSQLEARARVADRTWQRVAQRFVELISPESSA